jgi:hypothetical protein
MPYITRDDGDRFVIPSYRDTLTAKKQSLLKREITLLAANYGDYVTLQRKGRDDYEVAFSSDAGYLLGETIWAYFNRPRDLIYCEVIPNTSEAILVIVKNGSVYLDGSFPIDSIPEELVIFKTQQNQFDIYIYGDVPISQTPEEGKFSFDATSIHSFNVLEKPVFELLPVVKSFQLQLVDVVLKTQGIGVFPIKPVLMGIGFVVAIWVGWKIISTSKVELPTSIISVVNPYQVYINTLSSPSPSYQVQFMVDGISRMLSIPGWFPDSIDYAAGSLRAAVKSDGGRTNTLFKWAENNNADIQINQSGIYINLNEHLNDRLPPTTIHDMKEVLANLIDRLSYVIPGNPLTLGTSENRGQYIETSITIDFVDVSLSTLALIGQQLKDLPLVLSSARVKVKDGFLSGSLVLIALGK